MSLNLDDSLTGGSAKEGWSGWPYIGMLDTGVKMRACPACGALLSEPFIEPHARWHGLLSEALTWPELDPPTDPDDPMEGS